MSEEKEEGWWPPSIGAIIIALVVIAAMIGYGVWAKYNASWPFEEADIAPVGTKIFTPAPVASAPIGNASQSVSAASAPAPAASQVQPPPPTATPKQGGPAKAEAKAEVKIAKPKPAKEHMRPNLGVKPATIAASAAQPVASTPVKVWEHWGAAPYAASEAEACRKAAEAIDGLNAPAIIKERLKRRIGTTCEGGTMVWLTPHQRLDQMWSGSDGSHSSAYVMTNVDVAELPVVRAPDGRLYRKGAVAEAAKALSWTEVDEGRSYVLYLPYECFNWSIGIGPAPTLPAPVAAAPVPTQPLGACPDVYTLNLRVWRDSVRRLPGIAETIDAERNIVNGFANGIDFSRHYGKQLRDAEKAKNPDARLSQTPHRFRISLIKTPEARGGPSTITEEEVLYDSDRTPVIVTGLFEMRFRKAVLEKWDAIRAVSVDSDMQSPPLFGRTGLHELRFFNHLPMQLFGRPEKNLGEWDTNPVPDCLMNKHAVEVASPVPPVVQ